MTTLRFSSTTDTESQINITRNNDGHFDVVQYRLPNGSKSLDAQLSALYIEDKLSPTQDPAELAKQFKVEARTVEVPAKVLTSFFDQLNQLRFPSIPLKPSKFSIAPEGSVYKLWYLTTLNEVQFYYVDAGHIDGDGNAKAIADWMDRVKNAVDSIK